MEHTPEPNETNPEDEYGELRAGRPTAGIRFPESPEAEPADATAGGDEKTPDGH